MKIAILGARGQLGQALGNALSSHVLINVEHFDCAVEDYDSVVRAFEGKSVDIIINCAAMHKVDACEVDYQRAYAVNTIGAYNVAKYAASVGAEVFFFSTDYVFDGIKKNAYTESDLPHPLNIYGASKLAGEHAVAIANSRHYIIRTSALFGGVPAGKGKNFVMQMLDKARDGDRVTVVDDQYTSPTYVVDFAEALRGIIETKIPHGVYHVVGTGNVSWYDYVGEIYRQAGINHPVHRSVTTQEEGKAVRPLFSVISPEKINGQGITLPPWQEALSRYLKTVK